MGSVRPVVGHRSVWWGDDRSLRDWTSHLSNCPLSDAEYLQKIRARENT